VAKPKPQLHAALREKLLVRLRATIAGSTSDPRLAEYLLLELEGFAKTNGAAAPLRTLLKQGGGLPLSTRMREWVTQLPETHRSTWLLDQITEAAGLTWGEGVADPAGPIVLPGAARARILQRFERLWERLLSRHDQEPEVEEYAELLEEELERLARTSDTFATRLLVRRFPASNGAAPSLTFFEKLAREGVPSSVKILAFAEEHLDIRWSERDPERAAEQAQAPPRAYLPGERYAVGERVEHPKFGVGTVVEIAPARAKVAFVDGARTLATR